MCLTKAKKSYINKTPLTVWKVFLFENNKLFGGCFNGHEFHIGLNTDINEEPIMDDFGSYYPAGFHVHTTKRSAKRY